MEIMNERGTSGTSLLWFVPELCLFHSLDLQQFTLHFLSHWIIL